MHDYDRRTAALLDDFGLTEALVRMTKPWLQKLTRLAEKDDVWGIGAAGRSFGVQRGSVADLVKGGRAVHPELLQYSYIVGSEQGYASRIKWWVRGFYDAGSRRMHVLVNTDQAILYDYPSELPVWKEKAKPNFLREIGTLDLVIRHEVTHLIRDAQTGYIRQRTQNWSQKQQQKYIERGHTTFDYEIDAQVNELGMLRKKLGPSKYKALTLSSLAKILWWHTWIDKPDIIRRYWRKRLIREGLWTPGMEAELNGQSLARAASLQF